MNMPVIYWDTSHYYKDFVEWVNSIFMWVAIGFLAVVAIEAIISLIVAIRSRNDSSCYERPGQVFTRWICSFLWVTLVVAIGVFAILCVIRATPVFFGDQDYNLLGHWYGSDAEAGLVSNTAIVIITTVLGVGGGIAIAIVCFSNDLGFWSILIGLGSGAAIWALCLWAIGFVVYCIVWVLYLVFCFLYLMIAGFGMAIGIFVSNNWLPIVIFIGALAATIGLVTALVGYIRAFAANVKPIRYGVRYSPSAAYANASRTSSSPRVETPRVEEPAAKEEPTVTEEPVVVETPAPARRKKAADRIVEQPAAAPVADETPVESNDDDEASEGSYVGKIQALEGDLRGFYNQLKAELLSYGLTARTLKAGETFRSGNKLLAKITVRGKALKVYFALNPADYEGTSIPVLDVSSIGAYSEVPCCFKIKSALSLRRALSLVSDVAGANNLTQGDVEEKDYAAMLSE